MRTPDAAIRLIKRFESFRPTWYADPGGVLTIGYGFTSMTKGLRLDTGEPEEITREQATDMLRHAIGRHYEPRMIRHLKYPRNLNDEQIGALVSFVWNVGIRAFSRSTVKEMIDQHLYHAATVEMLRWTHADGRHYDGLQRRRKAEVRLFRPDEEPDVNEVEAAPVTQIQRDDSVPESVDGLFSTL